MNTLCLTRTAGLSSNLTAKHLCDQEMQTVGKYRTVKPLGLPCGIIGVRIVLCECLVVTVHAFSSCISKRNLYGLYSTHQILETCINMDKILNKDTDYSLNIMSRQTSPVWHSAGLVGHLVGILYDGIIKMWLTGPD